MSSIFFHKNSLNVTTIGSSAKFSTVNLKGILMHLIVRANTPSTIFDVTIYDEDNVILKEWNDVDGEVNETNMGMPLSGDYTVQISNAGKDEVFRIYLAMREI